MNNELQKHKSGDKIKWILTLLAFILVGVMLAGIICGWFDNVNKPAEDKTPQENVTDNDEPLEVNTTPSQFMSLKVARLAANEVATYAENSYSLEATVYPEDADDQTVDYFIAWANKSSTWASGKKVTDYYSIAQTSDGSKTATLSCKQPAGEQAIVTVVSRSNPQAKATATVDYVQKLLKCTGNVLDGDPSTIKTWTWQALTNTEENIQGSAWSNNVLSAGNFEWSVGSKEDTIVSKTISIAASSELKANLNTYFTSSGDRSVFAKTYTYPINISQASLFYAGGNTPVGLLSPCAEAYDEGCDIIQSAKFNNLKSAMKASSVDFVVTVKVQLAKGGTYTASYNVNVADSSLVTAVTSLGINNTEIEF